MSSEAMCAILRAYLAKQGLVIGKASDIQGALTGACQDEALTGIIALVNDTSMVAEWQDDHPTAPVPQELLAQLRAS